MPVLPGTGGGALNLGRLALDGVDVTGNRAVGDREVVVAAGPAFKTAGGAIGGGVGNYGTLVVRGGSFTGNRAVGADDVTYEPTDASAFPLGTFPGNTFGGAIGNFTIGYGPASASITGTDFVRNESLAGDRGVGQFAAIAAGGAIGNESAMTITDSRFRFNRAVAGDDSTSPFHNGHALGGALSSGSLTPAVDSASAGASTEITGAEFFGNEAIGGDRNTVTMRLDQIPRADAPDNGYGGAILAYQGQIAISQSALVRNRAVGGDGGADAGGSLGVGGGVFFFNFLGPVSGTLDRSVVSQNAAIGGDGAAGGDGLGGGVAIGRLGAPFGEVGSVAITDTAVMHNRASGGDGAAGGDGLGGGIAVLDGGDATVEGSVVAFNRASGGRGATGGDGEGGGIYVADSASLTLRQSLVALNFAVGGHGRHGGARGRGQGGGIAVADGGTAGADAFSRALLRLNHASDDGDDLEGQLDLI